MSRNTLIAAAILIAIAAILFLRSGGDDAGDRIAGRERPGPMATAKAGQPGTLRDANGGPKRLKLASKPLPGAAREMADPNYTPRAYDEADIPKLMKTVEEDPDPTERAAAITDLSLLDPAQALPALQKGAKDPDDDVRLAVVIAIGRYGDQAPIDLIAQFSQDPDPEMRLETLDVIESLLDEEAISIRLRQFVEVAARDPDEDVRDRAQDILNQLDEVSDGVELSPDGYGPPSD